MKLTRHTDYALRILIYSALKPDGELLSIQEVTDAFELSRNHVMKIVQKLGQEGYLQTVRGKGGGFRIGRRPAEINVGQLIRVMEHNLKMVDCESPMCRIFPSCKLNGILAEALNAFLATLDQYTLEDLLTNKKDLGTLLAIG